jgi:RimJ/RimL family protein N-acetyltransferase
MAAAAVSPTSIVFTKKDGGLHVTIETQRLRIESVTQKCLADYEALCGSQAVMKTYHDGIPRTKEWVQQRMDAWTKRWADGDPYSPFAIFDKKTNQFIGNIVAGHGDLPGESEIAYLLKEDAWGKHYGTEAASALVRNYLPQTVQKGYKLDGQVLYNLCATARVDNLGSVRILQGLGMSALETSYKYGALRHNYSFHEKNPFLFSMGKTLAECSMQELLKLDSKCE